MGKLCEMILMNTKRLWENINNIEILGNSTVRNVMLESITARVHGVTEEIKLKKEWKA